MQMAIDVAGFTAAEADELRQAMGAKRSRERMERLRCRLYAGMSERGLKAKSLTRFGTKWLLLLITGSQKAIRFRLRTSFTPHHGLSTTTRRLWCCAAQLAADGVYSPHSLAQDARRHGVKVLTPDLNASADQAILESCDKSVDGVAVRLGFHLLEVSAQI